MKRLPIAAVDPAQRASRRPSPAAVAWLAATALLGAACAGGSEARDAGRASDSALAPFPEAVELMTADRAFAADSRLRGVEAWVDVWASDGRLGDAAPDGGAGAGAVRAAMSPVLARYGPRFRWSPAESGMLWPDSLGYTAGPYWIDPDGGGAPADSGHYLTVWKRERGVWKVALDLSLPDPADDDASRDFDFWLGDWRVDQRIWAGHGEAYERHRATDRVRRIGGGGALAESWEGEVRFAWEGMTSPARMRAATVGVYDPDSGRWRIFRIDSLHGAFGPPFQGRFDAVPATGTFDRAIPLPDGRRSTIAFRPRGDGGVDWSLAMADPDGSSRRRLWIMRFQPGRTAR